MSEGTERHNEVLGGRIRALVVPARYDYRDEPRDDIVQDEEGGIVLELEDSAG